MFEYHGRATILDSAGCEDDEDDPADATLDAIRAAIADVHMKDAAALVPRNGTWFLTILGFNNHRQHGVVEC